MGGKDAQTHFKLSLPLKNNRGSFNCRIATISERTGKATATGGRGHGGKAKTAVVKASLYPVWNEVLLVGGPESKRGVEDGDALTVAIKDKDRFVDDFLGESVCSKSVGLGQLQFPKIPPPPKCARTNDGKGSRNIAILPKKINCRFWPYRQGVGAGA